MRKSIYKIGCLLALTTCALYGEETRSDDQQQKYNNSVIFYSVNQARGKVKEKKHDLHRKFGMSQHGFLASHTLKTSSGNMLVFSAGLQQDHLSWSQKPKFHQKKYNNANINIGTVITEIPQWTITAMGGVSINTEYASLSRYTLLQGYLEGVYQWKSNTNLHAGLRVVTAMRSTAVLPVFGFDYTLSDKWKFYCVLPTNIAAVYTINEQWSCLAGLRSFYSHQRLLKKHEPHAMRRGLITYRTTGAEINLRYKQAERIACTFYIGETLGGRLRLSNRKDKERRHYTIGSAGYLGLSVSIGF